MPVKPNDGMLSNIDTTPHEKETIKADDLLHNVAIDVPAAEQAMSDEQEDLTDAEDEPLTDELKRLSTESSEAPTPD